MSVVVATMLSVINGVVEIVFLVVQSSLVIFSVLFEIHCSVDRGSLLEEDFPLNKLPKASQSEKAVAIICPTIVPYKISTRLIKH